MTDAPAPAISVRGLTKIYGDRAVVDHLDMDVPAGTIYGFLGPNGSGKTTTIRMMCGLLVPDDGEGSCLGYDIRTQSLNIKEHVGYMTQKFSLYEDLTIRENLDFMARMYRLKGRRKKVDLALEDLGLVDRQNQLAGTLSGGWKQRLALAACLLHEPRLLLLDEPTAGVDPKARRDFWDEIHRLAAGGLTVLVSTHYMDEAERCHRINYISYGKLVASGTVAEVLASAGLTTWILEGANLGAIARELAGMPGVDQIAPFGVTLHVVGRDAAAIERSVRQMAKSHGVTAEKGETSLEDVFIQFMAESTDNMGNGNMANGSPAGGGA